MSYKYTTLFFILLILFPLNAFVNLSSSGFLDSQAKIDETYKILKKISGTTFGKKILDTVTLQLKNETPLSDISKLINDLKSELENQQILADTNWEKMQIDCQAKLSDYSQRISKSSAEIEEAEFNIKRLAEDLSELQKIIENKNNQLQILSEKEEFIADLRAQDKADFEKKFSQITEILSAMNLIISKLGNLSESESNGDIQSALLELSEIGKSNPINSFVHFTMSFDQDTLSVVVEKLERIQKSLETALEEEKLFEDNAINNCKVLLSEIVITKKNLQEDIKGHKAQITELENNKRIQEGRRDQNKEELENCNKGKSQWSVQCTDFTQSYSENTNQRKKEINVINQIQMILAARMEIMKSFIEEGSEEQNSEENAIL